MRRRATSPTRAGYTAGTLYTCFKSLDELLLYVPASHAGPTSPDRLSVNLKDSPHPSGAPSRPCSRPSPSTYLSSLPCENRRPMDSGTFNPVPPEDAALIFRRFLLNRCEFNVKEIFADQASTLRGKFGKAPRSAGRSMERPTGITTGFDDLGCDTHGLTRHRHQP